MFQQIFQKIYLIYIYICNKLQISYNKYYVYSYDINKDVIQIRNITIIYYLLMIFFMTNNKRVMNFFLIKKKNIIIKNNNEQIFLLVNNNFSRGVIPKGIIENIIINIRNHRYELNNLKKNLFKIDSKIPLIFCLAYYENIKKINLCFLKLKYKKLFNKSLENSLLYKVKNDDILENLF
jgi:hypothetical protein